jgi:hypothetical protein
MWMRMVVPLLMRVPSAPAPAPGGLLRAGDIAGRRTEICGTVPATQARSRLAANAETGLFRADLSAFGGDHTPHLRRRQRQLDFIAPRVWLSSAADSQFAGGAL